MKQKITLRLTSEDGDPFFGKGVAELLHDVDETGSLNMATKKMQISYSKAWRMINKAEAVMGYPFVERTSGGKNGGGTVLTAEGREFLEQFDSYNEKLKEISEALFQEIFVQ